MIVELAEIGHRWRVASQRRSHQAVHGFAEPTGILEVAPIGRLQGGQPSGTQPTIEVRGVTEALHGPSVTITERREEVECAITRDEPERTRTGSEFRVFLVDRRHRPRYRIKR
jgi:hypothetical protein